MMGLSPLTPLHFEALEATKGVAPAASNLVKAAKEFGEETARWAFEQWSLRERAKSKFKRANEMLFDREGLEMASHERLGLVHALMFPSGSVIADLTCGIGGDLIQFADVGDRAIGYELDPWRAAMAEHNVRVHGFHAEIRVGDVMEGDWDFDFAYADPSRRSSSGRSLDPASFKPDPRALAEKMSQLSMGVMKLTPMLSDEFLRNLGRDVVFTSLGWECREALVRMGRRLDDLPEFVEAAEWAFLAESLAPLMGGGDSPDELAEPRALLFEANPAAIRAHCLPMLCSEMDAFPLGASNGYLTGDSCDEEWVGQFLPWVRIYKVLAHGRLDEKRIRQDLRSLDASVEAVKVRGVKEDPILWQKRLKTKGSRKVALALYPVEKSIRFAILERYEAGKKLIS